MRQDNEIKTYEIDSRGRITEIKNGEDNRSSNDSDLDEENLDEKVEYIKKANAQSGVDRDHIVNSNPFMVMASSARDAGVRSIEDFRIKVKHKESRSIGEVLRSDEYHQSKRKKIVLNAINKWIKEFKSSKSRILLKVCNNKEAVKPIELKKIKVGAYISLPMGLITLLIIYFNLTSIWSVAKDFNIFNLTLHLNFQAAKDSAFSSNWVNILAVCGIYLAIASLAFIGLYHAICNDYLRYSKKHTSINEKLANKINNGFNHKSKKTLKYYQKALHGRECKLDPLEIEETAVTDVDFSDLEAMADAYAHKKAKLGRRKVFLYFTQFILFKGAYLCSTGVVGYVMFELARGLFGGGI